MADLEVCAVLGWVRFHRWPVLHAALLWRGMVVHSSEVHHVGHVLCLLCRAGGDGHPSPKRHVLHRHADHWCMPSSKAWPKLCAP